MHTALATSPLDRCGTQEGELLQHHDTPHKSPVLFRSCLRSETAVNGSTAIAVAGEDHTRGVELAVSAPNPVS